MFKLFYSPGACSLVARIALEEAYCDYEDQIIDIRRGDNRNSDYLSINPKGRVPALLTDNGIITENCAILAYIAQSFPAARLAPLDTPYGFARMQSINATLAATIHPMFRNYGRPHLFVEAEEAHEDLRAHVKVMIHEQFQLLDAALGDGRTWILGRDYSLSDAYLAVFASYLENAFQTLKYFSHLIKHHKRVWRRPAVINALRRDGRL